MKNIVNPSLKSKYLQTDFAMVERHVEIINAPITKGRLPNWKK